MRKILAAWILFVVSSGCTTAKPSQVQNDGGGLTQNEVSGVIKSHLNEIRGCYEELLQRLPSASGKIAVKFVVALNGKVATVKVMKATLKDSAMIECVIGKVQRWAFPIPRGAQPVTVNYPFVFNPL